MNHNTKKKPDDFELEDEGGKESLDDQEISVLEQRKHGKRRVFQGTHTTRGNKISFSDYLSQSLFSILYEYSSNRPPSLSTQ